MNPVLRKRLLAAGAGGTIAIAAVMGNWYEGTGPTVKQPDGQTLYIPYKDPVGIWTVCRGVTGPEVIPAKRYTDAECTALEHKHLAIAEKAARRLFIHYDTYSPWTRAALIDWLYNLGENSATLNSTLRRKFNAGDKAGGCMELNKWVKARVKGQLVTLAGLEDRRKSEYLLCMERI